MGLKAFKPPAYGRVPGHRRGPSGSEGSTGSDRDGQKVSVSVVAARRSERAAPTEQQRRFVLASDVPCVARGNRGQLRLPAVPGPGPDRFQVELPARRLKIAIGPL